MGDSVRPDQMALLKSNDGVTFIPWEYKVTSSQECISVFDVSSTNTAVESSESVICNTYNLQAQPRNEIVSDKNNQNNEVKISNALLNLHGE